MDNLASSPLFPHTGNHGFSLIEVLISLLMLSLGMIGTIKMQSHAIQTSQQSHFYSTAIELASDMAEKIRSNVDQMRLEGSNPFLEVDFRSETDKPPTAGMCYAAGCSPGQLAKADIAEWLQHINAALPNVRAVICRDNASWNGNKNSLKWDCASPDEKAGVVIKLGWTEKNNTEANPPPRLAVAV